MLFLYLVIFKSISWGAWDLRVKLNELKRWTFKSLAFLREVDLISVDFFIKMLFSLDKGSGHGSCKQPKDDERTIASKLGLCARN